MFSLSLCFGWIKLKFGVRGNFRLLISNLTSQTQYRFEILRKCHFSSLKIMIFSPALPNEFGYHGNNE